MEKRLIIFKNVFSLKTKLLYYSEVRTNKAGLFSPKIFPADF